MDVGVSPLINRLLPVILILFAGYMLARACERLTTRFVWAIRARNLREREGTAPPDEDVASSTFSTHAPRAVFWLVIVGVFLFALDGLR